MRLDVDLLVTVRTQQFSWNTENDDSVSLTEYISLPVNSSNYTKEIDKLNSYQHLQRIRLLFVSRLLNGN